VSDPTKSTRKEPAGYEELDQEYSELVSELRVVLPGIQLLAGFLLILPFNGYKFESHQRWVYLVAFVGSVIASILTIAPTSQHRIRWREGDKERLLRTANRLTTAGLVCLAVALTASAYLVGEVVYSSKVAGALAAGFFAAAAWWWFAQAGIRQLRDR
jgi:hypothetical protein